MSLQILPTHYQSAGYSSALTDPLPRPPNKKRALTPLVLPDSPKMPLAHTFSTNSLNSSNATLVSLLLNSTTSSQRSFTNASETKNTPQPQTSPTSTTSLSSGFSFLDPSSFETDLLSPKKTPPSSSSTHLPPPPIIMPRFQAPPLSSPGLPSPSALRAYFSELFPSAAIKSAEPPISVSKNPQTSEGIGNQPLTLHKPSSSSEKQIDNPPHPLCKPLSFSAHTTMKSDESHLFPGFPYGLSPTFSSPVADSPSPTIRSFAHALPQQQGKIKIPGKACSLTDVCARPAATAGKNEVWCNF